MTALTHRYQQRLKRFTVSFIEWRLTLLIGVAFLFIAAMFGWRLPFTTLEPVMFDRALTVLVVAVLWLLTADVIGMLRVWSETKKLLHALANQPFSDGFKKVRLSWRQLTRLTVQQVQALRADPQLCEGRPKLQEVAKAADECRKRYVKLLLSKCSSKEQPRAPIATSTAVGCSGAAAQKQSKPDSQSTSEDALWECFTCLKVALVHAAGSLSQELQAPPSAVEVPPADKDQKEKGLELAVAEIGDNRKLEFILKDVVTAEHEKCVNFVCLLYTNYLVIGLLRIRSMAISAVGVFVLFVVAIMSYPFEPRGPIRSILLVIFAALMTAIALVYAQMHRDEILSRITQTTSGQLGMDFWLRMVGLIGLPLISLLAYQFPSVGSFLFSWVEPSVRSIH